MERSSAGHRGQRYYTFSSADLSQHRAHLGVDLGSVVTPNRSASAVALVMSVMLRGWHVAQIASKA